MLYEAIEGPTRLPLPRPYHLGGIGVDAIAHFRRACELSPRSSWGRLTLSATHWFKGDIQRASDMLRTLEPDFDAMARDWQSWLIACQGAVAARMGRAEEAREKLAQLLSDPTTRDRSSAIAWLYMELGEIDKAFEWLERAYERRDPFLAMMKVHPVFDVVGSDPRFPTFAGEGGAGGLMQS